MHRRNHILGSATLAAIFLALAVSASMAELPVAPTPEVAKKCMIYSYRVYPWKRPGSVKGSPARGIYMRDCVAKGGDVPEPPEPPKPAPRPNPKAASSHQDEAKQ